MENGRVINFSAGPCAFPLEVLERAKAELINWNGSGMSVIEMSHRGKEFMSIHNKALKDLRDILQVPSNFNIMLFQGGASLQFACIPLNLGNAKKKANYLTTGTWSQKSIEECKKYFNANEVASGKASKFTDVPSLESWNVDQDAAYFSYCQNETIHGVEFILNQEHKAKIGSQPVVCDFSSNALSRAIDWNIHDVVFGGAQKNMGPAGLTVVIAREDLVANKSLKFDITPTLCDWEVCFKNESMYNTPPCYSIYLAGLFFDYIKQKGGLAYVDEQSNLKSQLIYNAIDSSDGFYTNPVKKQYRSRMNIPFLLKDENQFKTFIAEAKQNKLVNLEGHRSVGGGRVSLYNGISVAETQALVDFMKDFAQRNAA